MNVTLVSPAAAGWSGVWEYASAADAAGNPTGWTALPLLADETGGLTRPGTITFDPPAGWKTATIGGSDRLFYVRLRVTAGTATQAPVLRAMIGAVSRAISPKWVLANTAGGKSDADPVAANSAAVFEEFILRPLDASWSDVGDAAGLVARRLAAPGSPYVVLDSYPAGGTAT